MVSRRDGLVQKLSPLRHVTEVRTFVRELRNRYTTENLPTTVPLSAVTEDHIALYEGASFMAQLSLVDYAGPSLRNAIIDYHRAVTQETAWLSDSLIDLESSKLRGGAAVRVGSRVRHHGGGPGIRFLSPEDAENAKQKAGRKPPEVPLELHRCHRPDALQRGILWRKRHELAGHDSAEQRIGWHPDFVDHIEAMAAG